MIMGILTSMSTMIPEPRNPYHSFKTEQNIYRHLLSNPTLRQDLLDKALLNRLTPYDGIYIHHPILSFPFVLFSDATDQEFVEDILRRLKPLSKPYPRKTPF